VGILLVAILWRSVDRLVASWRTIDVDKKNKGWNSTGIVDSEVNESLA
jgi:hypothetical protein